jgi:hypothetical protein
MLDQHLVHPLISRKSPHCSSPELRLDRVLMRLGFVKLGSTRHHGSPLLSGIRRPIILPARRQNRKLFDSVRLRRTKC